MAIQAPEARTIGALLDAYAGVLLDAYGVLVDARGVLPEAAPVAVLTAVVAALLMAIWWTFFSRATWIERLGVPLLTTAAMFAVFPFLHVSIRTGMSGFLFAIYALPIVALVVVGSAVVLRGRPLAIRGVVLAAAILLTVGAWTMVRTGGFKATPGAGHVFAHTIAHDEPHPLARPFALERFASGSLIDEHGAAAVAH